MYCYYLKSPILGILLIGIMISCSEDITPAIASLEPEQTPIIIPDGSEAYLNADSDFIFDQDSLYTYELIIPESNYAFINNDPAAEEYVEASLVFRGDTISPVGVRYKGSVGAFVNCLSNTDWSNPSGYKTCTKLSMKIKINWGDREEKFYKLKKLQFHSMNNDPSQFRERLGYHLFKEMGIPTPRCVHARLVINGEFIGLFAVVEQVDGRFAKYHFDDDDGNIYKERWPLDDTGIPFSSQQYIAALKTNEENMDVQIIKSFAQSLSITSSEQITDVIEEYMYIPEILSYCVVDRMIRHDDGPFHWYCNNNGCESHNFYWYEEPNNKKLHLIPWDLDNAFENIIFNVNPVTPIADKWGDTRNSCKPFFFGLFLTEQKSAACDPLTAGWASYTQEYLSLQNTFRTGPFAKNNIDPLLDKWTEQIMDATLDASNNHGDAVSLSRWENKKTELIEQIDFAREN